MIDPVRNLIYAMRDGSWESTFAPTTGEDLFHLDETFTRSNGTVVARLYERLTKASRRRAEPPFQYTESGLELREAERCYRLGVYDAFQALQDELSK